MLLLLIVLLLLIGAGGWGYRSGGLNLNSPLGIVLLIVVVLLLVGLLPGLGLYRY